MNCSSVPADVPSVSRTRAFRDCSAIRARSCSTGWAKRMIRSIRVPEDSADLLRGLAGPDAGLDHPRREGVAEVLDGAEPGVAAGGGPDALVDRQLETLLATVGALAGQDEALAVVGERQQAQCCA